METGLLVPRIFRILLYSCIFIRAHLLRAQPIPIRAKRTLVHHAQHAHQKLFAFLTKTRAFNTVVKNEDTF